MPPDSAAAPDATPSQHPQTHQPRRLRIRVRGLVQGVGFRPHVYGLACRHGLSGWVCNDGAGVSIEVQGDAVEAFVTELKDQAPPLSRIDELLIEDIAPKAETGFSSAPAGPAR